MSLFMIVLHQAPAKRLLQRVDLPNRRPSARLVIVDRTIPQQIGWTAVISICVFHGGACRKPPA
jgi:hypothetical protein